MKKFFKKYKTVILSVGISLLAIFVLGYGLNGFGAFDDLKESFKEKVDSFFVKK